MILPERGLIKVSGEDAESFLQNLVTNDINKAVSGRLLYSALLTPQGRFLHDFFIYRDGDGFFIECEKSRREDLLRRLKLYKLRAKVTIEDLCDQFDVFAAAAPVAGLCFEDPRLEELGFRHYRPKVADLRGDESYRDRRISLGIPEGSDFRADTDTAAQANLDFLNAVSWDKGCYVGQEVTAMTQNRGAAKKRLVMISGMKLIPGEALMQNSENMGEIRVINSQGTAGLAMLKLTALNSPVTTREGAIVVARLPTWVNLHNP